MKRYKCIVEYDGANYSGFQSQINSNTIQDEIEKALSTLFKEQTKIYASGRTDAGVSAKGQVIHFDSETTIPAQKIPFAIKCLLPNDISILSCEEVASDFNARFDAKQKTYSYKVCLTQLNRPLYQKYYLYPYKLDLNLLDKSLNKMLGKHNFKAFMSSGSDVCTFEREIYQIKRVQQEQDCFTIFITANGFLYNMVRIIVGLCLDIARGRYDIDIIDQMFESGDRNLGGHTAPPHPLCLESVEY